MTRISERRGVPLIYLPVLSALRSVTVNFGKALCGCWQESLLSGAAGTRCGCETTTRYNDAPQMIIYAFHTVLFLVLRGFTLVR